MQSDRQKDRAKEFRCVVVLNGAAETSGHLFGHCVLAAFSEERSIALWDLLVQGSDCRHGLRQTEQRRECRTIGDERRILDIPIGADQKPVTPVALDGRKIECVEDRNLIISRGMSQPVLQGAAIVSPFLRMRGLRTAGLGGQVFQIRAPETLSTAKPSRNY